MQRIKFTVVDEGDRDRSAGAYKADEGPGVCNKERSRRTIDRIIDGLRA
jgi:hypothetical protein